MRGSEDPHFGVRAYPIATITNPIAASIMALFSAFQSIINIAPFYFMVSFNCEKKEPPKGPSF